jgi:hypothetical protein
MVVRVAPDADADTDRFDAEGLISAYTSLRDAVGQLSQDLGVSAGEFEAQFAPVPARTAGAVQGPRADDETTRTANTAALLLRKLGGYIEGLVEAVVLDQQISTEQVRAAREAAKPQTGFR